MSEPQENQFGLPDGKLPEKIRFDYIKSNLFRVVHADGVWGGLTPGMDLLITFWSERLPIPDQMTYRVEVDGTLGDEVREERKQRDAVVREVEASVVMDLPTARAFLAWLKDRIDQADKMAEISPKNGPTEGEAHV